MNAVIATKNLFNNTIGGGMKDTRSLTTRLLSEASQENCDGVEHDLMIEAYHRIIKTHKLLVETQDKYNEILYQVQNVIPNQSRHDRAIEIIRAHENRANQRESGG